MKYLLTALALLLTVSFTAQETTITYPYNPDGNGDEFIAIYDLQDLLSAYGQTWVPGEIQVNSISLSTYLDALEALILVNSLPQGTSDGQFLKWNGSEWVLVFPSVGCTDSGACNYDSSATTNYIALCTYPDACGVCGGPGEIYGCGCSDLPEGDCDCDGNQVDALNVCGGTCSEDLDEDGICDDGDSCIGQADECGVCNGPGAIYDCGCTEPAPDTCDCDGNVVDAVGVCGGGCQEDVDTDGICDNQDDCIGALDACGVCNGPGPILGCGCENIPEGDCDCQGNQLDAVGTCGGACQTDVNGDGVCDDDSIEGCTYSVACNYDPSASLYDGSCDFITCYGCTDIAACNYLETATIDNQSCSYPLFALDCDFNCLIDSDGDGYCDELEIHGCTDESACNFEAGATELDESCTYSGCTDPAFCSFNPEAGCDDGSCADGYAACMDSEACNYDSEAICGGVECLYPGCTNSQGTNYDPLAGCDDGSCIIEGCIIVLACNFDPLVNLDDGSCEFGTCPGCNNPLADNYNPTSTNDEICAYTTTFTNCGQEGLNGPSQVQVNQEYGVGSGITVIDGIQYWIVPESGNYRIESFGAQGGTGQGYTGGLGAMMGGYVSVTEGETLKILIGQQGGNSSSYKAGGGGGGSFVTDANNNPLVIAGGGGGGGGNSNPGTGNPGLITSSGGNSNNYTGGSAGSGGGGTSGSGGGGGLLTNGSNAYTSGGSSFMNGGAGSAGGVCAAGGGYGGFGGGSGGEWCEQGATGAGGGYSGGAGTESYGVAGGGGSYNSGTSQDNESGVNSGHGRVVITFIP